ncbi:hypothetical protein Y032_0083g1634 [Ancylostoma ceylanicum]|uniref:Uncharacterized protein n=1 Tax=Ancylostoma ceylanicum TaxID=53326 RepID=A0A016TRY8_9BILA|nr:hypothetical protein Y032_0083g1634 [Ancylostoma ceylanicum]
MGRKQQVQGAWNRFEDGWNFLLGDDQVRACGDEFSFVTRFERHPSSSHSCPFQARRKSNQEIVDGIIECHDSFKMMPSLST